jgi:hypothetical protein
MTKMEMKAIEVLLRTAIQENKAIPQNEKVKEKKKQIDS